MKFVVCAVVMLVTVATVNCFYKYPRYSYEYAVHDPHTQDIKSQWEARDGDNVRGSYSLVEADGSRRVVDYMADGHNGFNAVVKRQGYHQHPAHHGHHHNMAPRYYK